MFGRGPAQLSPARTDPNARVIAELQDQITMAKQRNEIARLDNEWAQLNKGESLWTFSGSRSAHDSAFHLIPEDLRDGLRRVADES